MRARHILSIMILILILDPSLHAFQTVGQSMVDSPFKGVLPIDAQLGKLADTFSGTHPAEALTLVALNGRYGPEWFSRNVHKDARAHLAKVYGDLLARILPGRPVLGSMVTHGSHAVVPVRLEAMVGASVFLELIWERDESGRWSIVSMAAR